MSYWYIIILLILLYIICNNDKQIKEEFSYYCQEKCEGRKIGQCMSCFNCGFISKNGKGKCIEGNMYGPKKNKPEYNNARWIYNEAFWNDLYISDGMIQPASELNKNNYAKYP